MTLNDYSRLNPVLHDRGITSGLITVDLESNALTTEVHQSAMIGA